MGRTEGLAVGWAGVEGAGVLHGKGSVRGRHSNPESTEQQQDKTEEEPKTGAL